MPLIHHIHQATIRILAFIIARKLSQSYFVFASQFSNSPMTQSVTQGMYFGSKQSIIARTISSFLPEEK
jgi:hypothetical protein